MAILCCIIITIDYINDWSTCTSPSSWWSSATRPFNPCLMMMLLPPPTILVAPPILADPRCSTVSSRLFTASTTTFVYDPPPPSQPCSPFPLQRPPGVDVVPPTAPLLPVSGQFTQPLTSPPLTLGPALPLVYPRSHRPDTLSSSQLYALKPRVGSLYCLHHRVKQFPGLQPKQQDRLNRRPVKQGWYPAFHSLLSQQLSQTPPNHLNLAGFLVHHRPVTFRGTWTASPLLSIYHPTCHTIWTLSPLPSGISLHCTSAATSPSPGYTYLSYGDISSSSFAFACHSLITMAGGAAPPELSPLGPSNIDT